jgi:hypothetical protein
MRRPVDDEAGATAVRGGPGSTFRGGILAKFKAAREKSEIA